ncbi:unknown [Clostridium sp. CAG:448]|nr:unknown [Clostridium sp. CAG:448]
MCDEVDCADNNDPQRDHGKDRRICVGSKKRGKIDRT